MSCCKTAGAQTKSLPWLQDWVREQNRSQAFVRSICDTRIHHQHQASFEAPPEAGNAVLAVNDLARSVQHAFSVLLALRLLAGCDDSHGNGKELCQGAGDGPERQLDSGGRDDGGLGGLDVGVAHGVVPEEVGKVGGGHAEQRAGHAGVQAQRAIIEDDF